MIIDVINAIEDMRIERFKERETLGSKIELAVYMAPEYIYACLSERGEFSGCARELSFNGKIADVPVFEVRTMKSDQSHPEFRVVEVNP